MINKILAIIMGMFILTSISANAIDKDTLSRMGKEKFTGWYADRDAQSRIYFKNGEILKNNWIDDKGKCYLDENGLVVKGWKQINKPLFLGVKD